MSPGLKSTSKWYTVKKVRVRGPGSHELAWLLAYILTWRHSCRQAGGSRPCTKAPGTHCHLKQWQYFLPVEIVTLCHLKYWYSGIWNSDFLPSGTESRVTHKGLTNRVHAVIWKGTCGHLKQSTRNMLVFESIIKAPKTCYHNSKHQKQAATVCETDHRESVFV